MASLAAVSSATPSLQSALMRSRVEQARREADQAQAYANELRQQLQTQEQATQQAQGRVQSLEQGLRVNQPNPTTSNQQPKETAATQTTAVPTPAEPTYLNTLGAVFKSAQPILALDLTNVQKNVVKASLFEAVNTSWSTPATSATVTNSYTPQASVTQPASSGRLLNLAV